MKLLHVISSAAATGGGPIEAVRQLSEAHMRRGHSVELATLDAPGTPSLTTLRTPIHMLGPGLRNYGYAPRMVRWLRENRGGYDAVVVNGLWQYHSYAVRHALRGSSTPYVVYPHGMLDPWFARQFPLKHLKKWLYWPWADYRVLRDAQAVLFTCEEERRLAPESFWLYRAHAVVTGLGIAAPEIDLGAAAAAWWTRYPELRGKRLVLFLGRIHPKKGCDLLISSFAAALADDESWQLVMAGPDQRGWVAELRALAAQLGIGDRITWPGMLDERQKWTALAAAEVFALPSHQENFGVAVAEALACGKPVLISDQVNIWREIAECKAGLVAPDTLAGTESLLRSWRETPLSEHEGYRERALACFERHFDAESSAERMLEAVRTGVA